MRKVLCMAGCCLLLAVASKAQNEEGEETRTWDKRWFLAPGLKLQAQDFAFLEKNRMGYKSNANTLPLKARGNVSAAISVYKNLSSRFAFSADVGYDYGNVTNDKVQIADALAKSYNALNASVYFHLLSARFKLQPYIYGGFNALVHDQAFMSIPAGAGVKFNARGIMLLGQAAYGFKVNQNISNTMIYSLGVYLPISNKKLQPRKKPADKKETGTGGNGAPTNVFVVMPSNDSLFKVLQGRLDDLSKAVAAGGSNGKNGNGRNGLNGESEYSEGTDSLGNPLPPSIAKFIIYFNYDEHTLLSSAFNVLDQVVYRLKQDNTLFVDLIGYTDLYGSQDYNQPLSKKRAEIAYNYLASRGIPQSRMFFNYYGKKNPIVNTQNKKDDWQNRRTEIILYRKH
ncbi:OmpA family protein [Deminuibacter soli]|nr:OmpA family protein [Deminuibacter soli]